MSTNIKSLESLNRYVSGNLGKNLLTNGDFSVWQRGDVGTGIDVTAADRWRSNVTGQTFTKVISGLKTMVELTSTVNNAAIGQKIENGYLLSGLKVSLSFDWEVVSGTIGTPIIYTFFDGKDVFGAPVPDPTTNGRKEVSFTMLSDASYGDYLEVGIEKGDSGVTLRVANIQLELGDTATDFEVVDPATQLARCQRYYWKAQTRFNSMTKRNVSTQIVVFFQFPVRMFKVPVITIPDTFSIEDPWTSGFSSTGSGVTSSSSHIGVDGGETIISGFTGLPLNVLLATVSIMEFDAEID